MRTVCADGNRQRHPVHSMAPGSIGELMKTVSLYLWIVRTCRYICFGSTYNYTLMTNYGWIMSSMRNMYASAVVVQWLTARVLNLGFIFSTQLIPRPRPYNSRYQRRSNNYVQRYWDASDVKILSFLKIVIYRSFDIYIYIYETGWSITVVIIW